MGLQRLKEKLEATRLRLAALNERLDAEQGLGDARMAEDLERSRASLAEFVQRGWHVLEPERAYVRGWAVDAICEHLQAVSDGQLTRLLINVPPGTSKSMTTSVFWPAWEWGPRGRPSRRFIGASYSPALSIRDNRRCRTLVTSGWYQNRWAVELKADQNAKVRFDTTATGWKFATSTGGVGTGERADVFVIDDPHNVASGESDARREQTLLWFSETVPTRVNDPAHSAIVVIMQRVHASDVSGHILARELGYEHLCLPMEFEPARRCVTSIGFEDPREEEGELLFPERFPAEVVERDKVALGSYAWAGQMQQRPAPRGGGMLQVDRLEIVTDYPRAGARLVRRWDFAGTEASVATDPDWTAGALCALAADGTFYVLDLVRERLSPGRVKGLVRQTAMRDGYPVPIELPQDPGSAGKAVLHDFQAQTLLGWATYGTRETGSKVQRAEPLAAAIEAGNVKLVQGGWNDALLAEFRDFPFGLHDDIVDAVAGAYLFLTQRKQPPKAVLPPALLKASPVPPAA